MVSIIIYYFTHNLYHTLFGSHLSYATSVWGGVSEAKINHLFIAQKHCIRILFGDKEKYLEKHRTAAGTRHSDLQILGSDSLRGGGPMGIFL